MTLTKSLNKLRRSLTLLACATLVPSWVSMTAHAQTAQAPTKKLEPITYLLPISPNLPAFAPWMIAKQLGYYEDEGLDMTFVVGKGGMDAAKQIGAGNAVIGGASGDTLIIARANDIPIKGVAVLGAGTMTLIASHTKNPVKEPADLKGKTITVVAYTDTSYYSLLGTMKKAGLTRDDASIQAAGPSGIWQLFASGKADAMLAVPEWIVAAEEGGAKVTWMEPSKGVNSMAQAILVAEDFIDKNPKAIQGVVRATLRAMKLLMTDTDAAVDAYIQAVPMHKGNEVKMRRIFDLYKQYIYADQKVLGHIDAQRLSSLQDFYAGEGVVRKTSPVETLYTNQFIKGDL